MIEEAIKENTAAVIDLTAAIQELAKAKPSQATAKEPTKPSKGKATSKDKKEPEDKPAKDDAGDLLGGDDEDPEEVTYDMLRELAQKAINDDKVDGLRDIVKNKLKAGSLSDLDEEYYEKAHKLLTKLTK